MSALLVKFYYLNTMGRIEGPPLAGVLFLVGAAFILPGPTLPVLVAAFFMTIFCMNYVYLINGVTDIQEDSINAPNRPLSKGVIQIREARIYTNVLFVMTLIYPLIVHPQWSERILVWMVLFMGHFYSCPPVRFKRYPPLATIYLVVNFNIPIVLGYWMATAKTEIPHFLLSTTFLFLANMPLKDYGDRFGDAEAGVNNWVRVAGGTRNLLIISSSLSIIGTILCYGVLPHNLPSRWIFVFLPLLPTINICLHNIFKLNMDRMFTHGVRALILIGIIYILMKWA